jgi:carbonic anhydrase/SulP family sulfate permease
MLSGSHTSVSGPAAGLTAVVAAQLSALGKNYEAFLLAVVLAGAIQIAFGLLKAGALSAFFPSSVIKGLLAAIGVILILKQLPVLFGYTKDMGIEFGHVEAMEDFAKHPDAVVDRSHPVGDIFVSFYKAMQDLIHFEGGVQWGAFAIGIFSLLFLTGWDKVKALKKSLVPSPLLVVVFSAILGYLFSKWGGNWKLTPQHLVDVPSLQNWNEISAAIRMPDFSQLSNSAVYVSAITIAVVASLETLLNLDAVDKLDKKQRISPPNRELFAQGAGNLVAGMIGGIPVTSVIIRSSVNVNSGAQTKLSAILHGFLLLGCVLLIPQLLQMIPMSCLAALLLLTGFKLASPALFKQMWSEGLYQFLPFIITLTAIVMTDLLVGICIGLILSLLFILHSNLRVPIKRIHEKHIDGEILHIELPNQVSFLNKAALEASLREAPRGSRVMLDARRADYIDPDVLSLITDFQHKTAPAFDLQFQVVGLKDRYKLLVKQDGKIDYSIQEARDLLAPDQVIQILAEGNNRFAEGHPLDRDLRHSFTNGERPKPFVAFVTGIDSRTPVEIIFDLGLGEAYVVRTPGKVLGTHVIGGIEFAAFVGGVKAIVIMGHAESSLLELAVANTAAPVNELAQAGCTNLDGVLKDICQTIDRQEALGFSNMNSQDQQAYLKQLARRNVLRSVRQIHEQSPALNRLIKSGKLIVIGAVFDVHTNRVEFLRD